MAYFTPAELPENKYYIFGKEGCKNLAKEMNVPLLAQILSFRASARVVMMVRLLLPRLIPLPVRHSSALPKA